MTAPPLVLASASPRRTAILDMLGLAHEVMPARVAEVPRPDEPPEAYVERLAREKAAAVAAARPDAIVLAADTEVVLDGEVLGKPVGAAAAVQLLLRLSGREHAVLTGVAVAAPGGEVHASVERTTVRFRAFGRADAEAYAATGEPLDKAGAYGIQGMGAALVSAVDGDYYTVVGLPVAGLLRLLERAGWRYRFGGRLEAITPEHA